MTRATTMQAPSSTAALTILYDETCALCRRARDWLLTQPCLVPVELLAAGSEEAQRRYAGLPWLGQELVVVDENGNAWVGPSAFLASMWATARYRSWAFRLSRPELARHAERFFRWISKRRDRWSARIHEDPECSWCDEEPSRGSTPVIACENGHAMNEDQNYCRVCGTRRVAWWPQL
jgi:predicted DCC family thiol-disulfide oxidoreductase YuxK